MRLLKKIFYFVILTVILFSGFGFRVYSKGIEETDVVVFSGGKAYFKFVDIETTKEIINHRWSKHVNLSELEKSQLYAYTYNEATPINSDLDSGKGNITNLSEINQRKVQVLDCLTNKLEVPWNMIVYRYVSTDFLKSIGFSKEDISEYYSNGVFDKGILNKLKSLSNKMYIKYSYMSTTAIRNAAMTHRPIELRIRVPSGVKAIFAEPYSAHPSEMEFLFPRGMRLELTDFALNQDNKKLLVEAIMFSI